jgi:hypothetical protein
MIEDLYDKVNAILAKQSALEKRLNQQNSEAASGAASNEPKKS